MLSPTKKYNKKETSISEQFNQGAGARSTELTGCTPTLREFEEDVDIGTFSGNNCCSLFSTDCRNYSRARSETLPHVLSRRSEHALINTLAHYSFYIYIRLSYKDFILIVYDIWFTMNFETPLPADIRDLALL